MRANPISVEPWLHALILLAALVAALTDWRTGRIPNGLTLPFLIGAFVLQGTFGGLSALVASAVGFALCALVPYLLFVRHAMGGGDVKLLAAIGAAAGPRLGVEVQFVALGLVAFFSLASLAWEGKLLATLGNTFFLAFNRILPCHRRRAVSPDLLVPVRMGAGIFAGSSIVLALHYPEVW